MGDWGKAARVCAAWVGAALLGTAAAAPPLPVAVQHGDWQLVCDNTRTCRAAGYQADGAEPAASILLTRAAGPQQPVRAQFMLGSYGDRAPQPAGRSLRLQVGARDYDAEADDGIGELDAGSTQALLAGLVRGDTVALQAGTVRWVVSSTGAAAALAGMDAVQERTGTIGALVRPGRADEAAVAPPLPVPVLRAARVPAAVPDATLALRLQPAVALPRRCESPPAGAPQAWRLGGGAVLLQAPCWRGADNEGHAFWVLREQAPHAPQLVTDSGTEYDGHGTLTATHRGRGLGDCTATQVWTWDGARFVHSAATTTGLCRLVAAGGAWDLPTLTTTIEAGEAQQP